MVGIQGVGGAPQPINANQTTANRYRDVGPDTALLRDRLAISDEAQKAAERVRLIQAANGTGSEALAQRVEHAKENLEKGTHRIQSVLLEVAARIGAYIEQP